MHDEDPDFPFRRRRRVQRASGAADLAPETKSFGAKARQKLQQHLQRAHRGHLEETGNRGANRSGGRLPRAEGVYDSDGAAPR